MKYSIYLASSPDVEGINGKYFVNEQPKESSEKSYNLENAEKLWKISAELTWLNI